ncbi:hypothetical protein SE17_04400 [Kouleothrix aurantiaca]|uniref:Uncharacterized protein n=1 Tax=Kouleothrix aurantiaca TaxID=186479 RepID=A0A0P9DLE5_9CHLR|nr:hypothetical protein SE17_04400 [Kouleothrix aurantiaca]
MQSTGIPAHHRQLTRQQILTRWQGQDRPRCHVELVRLYEPQPQTVFAGEAVLYLQWSDYVPSRPGSRRMRKRRANEPWRLCIISVSGGAWAEYDPEHGFADEDGTLVCEDYLMRLYAEDGLGRIQAEEAARWQNQVDALIGAVIQSFADLGVQAITLGDVTLATPPTIAGYVAQADRIAAAAMQAHAAAVEDTAAWAPHRDAARQQLTAICVQLEAAVEGTETIEGKLDAYEALTHVQGLILDLPVLAGDRY